MSLLKSIATRVGAKRGSPALAKTAIAHMPSVLKDVSKRVHLDPSAVSEIAEVSKLLSARRAAYFMQPKDAPFTKETTLAGDKLQDLIFGQTKPQLNSLHGTNHHKWAYQRANEILDVGRTRPGVLNLTGSNSEAYGPLNKLRSNEVSFGPEAERWGYSQLGIKPARNAAGGPLDVRTSGKASRWTKIGGKAFPLSNEGHRTFAPNVSKDPSRPGIPTPALHPAVFNSGKIGAHSLVTDKPVPISRAKIALGIGTSLGPVALAGVGAAQLGSDLMASSPPQLAMSGPTAGFGEEDRLGNPSYSSSQAYMDPMTYRTVGPMTPDRLGATGQLPLALHKMRRR